MNIADIASIKDLREMSFSELFTESLMRPIGLSGATPLSSAYGQMLLTM